MKRSLSYVVAVVSLGLFMACLQRIPLGANVASSDLYTLQYSELQTCNTDAGCTFTAPYWDGGGNTASAGASLNGVDGLRLAVCASGSQTLSGTGTMQAYWCDFVTAQCFRDVPLDQSVTASGVQCATFPDFKEGYVTGQPDTIEFVANAVGVSGTDGGKLTEYLYTHQLRFKP